MTAVEAKQNPISKLLIARSLSKGQNDQEQQDRKDDLEILHDCADYKFVLAHFPVLIIFGIVPDSREVNRPCFNCGEPGHKFFQCQNQRTRPRNWPRSNHQEERPILLQPDSQAGSIYILKLILPILTTISKCFQAGIASFAKKENDLPPAIRDEEGLITAIAQ
ncbi:hypothetical protein ACROYT_G015218 [Oculina patagonica]